MLQLLLRPTAGSSQPFQEDPHDCDEEEQTCEDGDGVEGDLDQKSV